MPRCILRSANSEIEQFAVLTPSKSMPDLRCSREPVLRIDANIWMRPLLVEEVGSGYVNALNDENVGRFLVSSRSGRYTLDNVRAMVRENYEAADAILFGIFCDGVHCGNVRLHDISDYVAYLGIAIFVVEKQGRGLGVKAITAVTNYALVELKMDAVLAGIDDRNIPSVRAFSKAGYKQMNKSDAGAGKLWKRERTTHAFTP
jgi:RimJ/RimL family protein N-acetyltransferase